MKNKEAKINRFFRKLWHEMEPFVVELLVYSIVIVAVAVVSYFTEPYLDDKLKESVFAIKRIVVIGELSLFAFHTIIVTLIRIVRGIITEVKNKDDGGDDDKDNNEDNDGISLIYDTKPILLNPKSAMDEIDISYNPKETDPEIAEIKSGE